MVVAPHIVDADDVVVVVVRNDDGIETLDFCAQHLRAEVGAGIHEPCALRRFHINGSAGALVALQRARSNLEQAGFKDEAALFYQRSIAQTVPAKKAPATKTKRKK